MSKAESVAVTDSGAPVSHLNTQFAQSGSEVEYIYEYPLYTDAHIVAEIIEGCGPYQFYNTVPDRQAQRVRPTVVLRAALHIPAEIYLKEKGAAERSYHGGSLQDELAALLSLSLGARFKSGDANREFTGANDCSGRPISRATLLGRDPIVPEISQQGPLIPFATREKDLVDASRICRLSELLPRSADGLIRAARLYQDALWIAESEPHLTWLMFTSAIEAAANCWQNEKEKPLTQLLSWGPGTKLKELFESVGQEELLEPVAELLAAYTGATQAFTNFLLTYVPDPPEERPPVSYQCPWTNQGLKKVFRKIYEYRSRALHNGTPFPAPMCLRPFVVAGNVWAEKPIGLRIGVTASWESKELPLHLHTFEYIVRNALLNWWDELLIAN